MKYKWSKRGNELTLQLTSRRASLVYLNWRDERGMRHMLLGSLVAHRPKAFYFNMTELSAVHHIEIVQRQRTYIRYIPSRYLNLSAEHD